MRHIPLGNDNSRINCQELKLRFGMNEVGSYRRHITLELQVSQGQRQEEVGVWQEKSREHYATAFLTPPVFDTGIGTPMSCRATGRNSLTWHSRFLAKTQEHIALSFSLLFPETRPSLRYQSWVSPRETGEFHLAQNTEPPVLMDGSVLWKDWHEAI